MYENLEYLKKYKQLNKQIKWYGSEKGKNEKLYINYVTINFF